MGPRYELDPPAVATKLIEGMKRNAQTMCRISGGEPTMHWDHLVAVIKEVIDRTQGLRMHVPGMTDRQGDCMGIVIETNGSMLDAKRLDALEAELGVEAARVVWTIGMKATHPEALADLTGLPLKVAARAHQRQLDALLHLALRSEHFVFFASFLDGCTDPGIYAALQREIERAKPGAGRTLNTQPLKYYGDSNSAMFTPKRFRGGAFPEPSPEHDPELITELIDVDGGIEAALAEVASVQTLLDAEEDPETRVELEDELREARDSVPSTVPVPVERPVDDPLLDVQLEFAAEVIKQDLPEGRMKR